jgi:hypothetical protein
MMMIMMEEEADFTFSLALKRRAIFAALLSILHARYIFRSSLY